MITELDLSVLPFPETIAPGADISQHVDLQQELNPYASGLPLQVQQQWQQRYLDLFTLFLRHQQHISRVTLWGVDDQQSWRNNWPMRGRTDYPLLFDRQQQAKPIVPELVRLAEAFAGTVPVPVVKVNQLGYLPKADKLAVIPSSSTVAFQLMDAVTDQVVWRGESSASRYWPLSDEWVSLADFSAWQQPGRYRLEVEGFAPVEVVIAAGVYDALHDAVIKAFYFNRASTALSAEYAGVWARAAGHPDTEVLIHSSAASAGRPAGTRISAAKGWYDAGDYNKYVVNSGITTYTLLRAWADFSQSYAQRRWQIPPSDHQLPDLLNEILWNLDWLSAMQDPGDGGVYHKLTTLNFAGAVMPDQARAPRYVVQKSTAAALNFAAVMAKASRTLSPFEQALPGRAEYYRQQALAAWQWALVHPELWYQQPDDVSTGAYGDQQLADEWAWAGVELYLLTGDTDFLSAFYALKTPMTTPSWAQVAALAHYSLATAEAIPAELQQRAGAAILNEARRIVAQHQQSPYQVAMTQADFVWGSNAVAMNKAMLLYQAWRIKPQPEWLAAMQGLLDYVLGRNPLDLSYVTGFGRRSPMHIHHRPSEADGNEHPVPGWLVGGPQPGRQDQCDYPYQAAATTYLDDWCSYATNEVAINWNAPLVYLLAAMQELERGAAQQP